MRLSTGWPAWSTTCSNSPEFRPARLVRRRSASDWMTWSPTAWRRSTRWPARAACSSPASTAVRSPSRGTAPSWIGRSPTWGPLRSGTRPPVAPAMGSWPRATVTPAWRYGTSAAASRPTTWPGCSTWGSAASPPARRLRAVPAWGSRSRGASSRPTTGRSRWQMSLGVAPSRSASPRPDRSAVAPDGGHHRGQRIGASRANALVPLDGEPFADPVLEAADHGAPRIAEPGKLQCGPGRAVAGRAPAITDDRRASRDERGGATCDLAGRQVQGTGDAPLGPRVVAPRVDENEVRAGLERSVHVRYVGLEVELGAEVCQCCHEVDAMGPAGQGAAAHPGICGD